MKGEVMMDLWATAEAAAREAALWAEGEPETAQRFYVDNSIEWDDNVSRSQTGDPEGGEAMLDERLNVAISAEAISAFEYGLAAGLRMAAGLIEKRVDGANRVVGTSRLYGDAVCIREAATMFEKGQEDLANSSLAQRFAR